MVRDWDAEQRTLIEADVAAFKRMDELMPTFSPREPGGTPMPEKSGDLAVYQQACEGSQKATAALNAFYKERRLHDPGWAGA